MSYKEKPILKLYKYINGSFVMQAQIDDYQEISFSHDRFQAGQFTIQINYNIPNAFLFERGLFVQFGNNCYDFGEISSIQDTIDQQGKGSQIRTIMGRDARYLFKRRVIRNLNDADSWTMTAKSEIVMRNLIKDQCGSGTELKRQLPIVNVIPSVQDAIGEEYCCKESFSNLYEVLQTIATQSEIGWRIKFENSTLTLEFYQGNDLHETVRFDTDFESLANGTFVDSSESFSNAIFVAGKGTGIDRDIYEGENKIQGSSPSGLDRFESYDNQSSMTTRDEYQAEALSMLNQYGQTLTVSGQGLVQCPYIFREQYDVGDIITISFSGKTAVVQILSVIEHWIFGEYELQFQFGKPINDLSDQLQLILRQIQKASSKTSACTSVKWYEIPTDTEQDSGDVIYDTLGFTGASSSDSFTIYLDDEGTGAKVYNLYVKNLTGSLTLTTGFNDAEDLIISGGTYTGSILVDTLGNISLQSSTVAVNETGVTPSGTANTITVGGQTYNLGGGGSGGGVPIGSIIAMHTSNPPNSNWLLCDGSTFDENVYPALYMYLGTNVLPDLRECTIVGAGQNTTNNIADHDVYNLGEFKDDQLQSHTHSYTKYNTRKDVNWSSAQHIWVGESSANTGTPTGRTGTTTHGKQVGENWFIKAVTSTPDSDFQGTVQTIKDYVDSKASYSTEETLTGGTWIDGKAIYRKVLTGTLTVSGGGSVQLSAWSNFSDIDTLIKLEGTFKQIAGGYTTLFNMNDINARLYIAQSGSPNGLVFNSSQARTNVHYQVTLEYTKS